MYSKTIVTMTVVTGIFKNHGFDSTTVIL